MEDTQYTQYYVAFLDILGFKNLINGSEATCHSILKIYRELDVMQKRILAINMEKRKM